MICWSCHGTNPQTFLAFEAEITAKLLGQLLYDEDRCTVRLYGSVSDDDVISKPSKEIQRPYGSV